MGIDVANRMPVEEYLSIVGTNQPGIPDCSDALAQILSGPLAPVSMRGVRLGPEDRLSASFYEFMKGELRDGRYRGVFAHVANESGQSGRDLKTTLRQHKKKAIGMVPGVTDWILLWRTSGGVLGGGGMELKARGLEGSLSDNQRLFRDWCRLFDIPWAVCNKLDAAQRTLIKWGAFK
jgi:hypothetical protein